MQKLQPGNDYLKPEIDLIIDDMVETNDQQKLLKFLNHWIIDKINNELKNLIDLKFIKEENLILEPWHIICMKIMV